MKRRESGPRRAVKRTITVVLMILLFNYLVLPRLAASRDSADLLRRVNPLLLLLALALEGASLVSYTVLTKCTLPPEPGLPLSRLLRIQLSTKAVGNLVPGGSAAGGTLGYRLLTEEGVEPAAAGFTLATVGLGSAVVLNVILWIALLISIPLNGFNPLYLTAALVGLVLIGSAAALVFLLMRGTDRAERILRAIARRLPFVDEDTASRFVHQLADRLRDLAGNPQLVRRGVLWATANWLLDAAALWVFLRAFGAFVNPVNLIVAYGLVSVLAVIPITPGGLGVVEAVLTPTLVGFGLTKSTATIGVLAWRFAQFWLPIPLGGLAYASLKLGPHGRRRRLTAMRSLATEAGQLAERRVWDEATGEYRVVRVDDARPEATG
ncbi:MAG: hypothetical protein JWM05_690 [Acidimicrobiales bacterium]|nr:hypothetical protein [Acidimicrobiales bacterium]